MGVGLFTGVKRPGRGANHPPLPVAEVKEKVELYMIHNCLLCSLQHKVFSLITVLLRTTSVYHQCNNGTLTVTLYLTYFKLILSLPFFTLL